VREVHAVMASRRGEAVGEVLENELQRQYQCFEELYRVTAQQHRLLQGGNPDDLLLAKREKDRLMLTIRLHTERLSELHEDWFKVQNLVATSTQDRITQKVRNLKALVHQILDLERQNFHIVRTRQKHARRFLTGSLPPEQDQGSRGSPDDQ